MVKWSWNKEKPVPGRDRGCGSEQSRALELMSRDDVFKNFFGLLSMFPLHRQIISITSFFCPFLFLVRPQKGCSSSKRASGALIHWLSRTHTSQLFWISNIPSAPVIRSLFSLFRHLANHKNACYPPDLIVGEFNASQWSAYVSCQGLSLLPQVCSTYIAPQSPLPHFFCFSSEPLFQTPRYRLL